MQDVNQIIHYLMNLLQGELPGKEAQYLMAPDMRDTSFPKNNCKNNEVIHSGVLILLYTKQNNLHLCCIKRPEYEGHHSGQVSFPGGKFEKEDYDLIQTALRETHEEVGVYKENIKVLGTLTKLCIPVSNMEVLPVVGFTNISPLFRIDPKEVEYIIEINLDRLLDPSNLKEMNLIIGERQIKAPYYNVKNEKIWGATAMMLSEFLEVYKKAI